jgi:putative thioredoxin
MNPWTVDVSELTFEREVLERSLDVPVIVDFWASWCGPCRVLGPLLERLAEEYAGGFVLAKVNVDENPSLAALFRIQGIPAVKIFKEGQLAGEFTGAVPESSLRDLLHRLVPSSESGVSAEAVKLEAAGRTEEAKAQYRAALEADPTNPAALAGLGRILLEEGDDEAALTHLENVPAGTPERREADSLIARVKLKDGAGRDEKALREAVRRNADDLEALFSLAGFLAARERYEEALEALFKIVAKDRGFRDDGARKTMLLIFDALGSDHKLTERFRSELAKVLFA